MFHYWRHTAEILIRPYDNRDIVATTAPAALKSDNTLLLQMMMRITITLSCYYLLVLMPRHMLRCLAAERYDEGDTPLLRHVSERQHGLHIELHTPYASCHVTIGLPPRHIDVFVITPRYYTHNIYLFHDCDTTSGAPHMPRYEAAIRHEAFIRRHKIGATPSCCHAATADVRSYRYTPCHAAFTELRRQRSVVATLIRCAKGRQARRRHACYCLSMGCTRFAATN